jgi:hypothetical protein
MHFVITGSQLKRKFNGAVQSMNRVGKLAARIVVMDWPNEGEYRTILTNYQTATDWKLRGKFYLDPFTF